MELLKAYCEAMYYGNYDASKLLKDVQQNISNSISTLDNEYAYVYYMIMNTRPCMYWDKDVFKQTESLLEKLFQSYSGALSIDSDTYNYFLMGYNAYCQLCATISDIGSFNIEQEIKTSRIYLSNATEILYFLENQLSTGTQKNNGEQYEQ